MITFVQIRISWNEDVRLMELSVTWNGQRPPR